MARSTGGSRIPCITCAVSCGSWMTTTGQHGQRDFSTTASYSEILGCTYRALLALVLIYHYLARDSNTAVLLAAPHYLIKRLLWDSDSVPLILSKLNMGFLSARNYLLRNFWLFLLTSMYRIRGDVMDVVKMMRQALKSNGYTARGKDMRG